MRIVISGATGRMGQTIANLVRDSSDYKLAGGVDRESSSGAASLRWGFDSIETAECAGPLIRGADAVIDFSAAEGLQNLLTACADDLSGKAIVVGTTGLSADVLKLLARASEKSPVIVSANYSIGVNLMLGVVAAAARVLPADKYDIEIVETHHRNKVDAPSGTALMLGRVVADARGTSLESIRKDGRSGNTGVRPTGLVGFHAVRGGEVVGEHRVQFFGPSERFEIVHAASDRALFAEGALVAAKWLLGKEPGSYSMKDVLGL